MTFVFLAPSFFQEGMLSLAFWTDLTELAPEDQHAALDWWGAHAPPNWDSLLNAPRVPPPQDPDRQLILLGLLFAWDFINRIYYRSGGQIPWDQVRMIMDDVLTSSQLAVAQATREFILGTQPFTSWRDLVVSEIKSSHLSMGALAKGGFNELSFNDLKFIQLQIDKQAAFFAELLRRLELGEYPLERLVSNATMYASSAWSTFYELERNEMLARGFRLERNILDPAAESCSMCIEQANRGFIPIGELVAIGSRDCLSNDRCYYEYSRALDAISAGP